MKRSQAALTDDWQQRQLLTDTPEQHTYELIRPVVRFGQPARAHATVTGLPRRTLYRQPDAFDRLGMVDRSLVQPPPASPRNARVPDARRL